MRSHSLVPRKCNQWKIKCDKSRIAFMSAWSGSPKYFWDAREADRASDRSAEAGERKRITAWKTCLREAPRTLPTAREIGGVAQAGGGRYNRATAANLRLCRGSTSLRNGRLRLAFVLSN